MGAKNSLTAADARLVEEAFRSKMASLGSGNEAAIEGQRCSSGSSQGPAATAVRMPVSAERSVKSSGVDKSQLALPEPRRLRDKTHVRFVSKQPCLICGRRPSDPHHLRFAQHPGLGRKVSDEFTVPLCRSHHRELHRSGDEASWWERVRVDAIAMARKLWTQTHPVRASTAGTNADVVAPTISTTREAANSNLDPQVSKPTSGSQIEARSEYVLPMTSLKQIEANRRNALKSTGPTSEQGKMRSRRNAIRHGLTAETVIDGLEDPEDYKAFEASVTADYDAQTAVERELVLRLASLLWRLRRATSIETGLLQSQ